MSYFASLGRRVFHFTDLTSGVSEIFDYVFLGFVIVLQGSELYWYIRNI